MCGCEEASAAMVTPLVKRNVVKKRMKKVKHVQLDRKICAKTKCRGNDTGLDQPAKRQRRILKNNGCFHETECLPEECVREEMSHCLRHRVVVPNCDLSARAPFGSAFQTQIEQTELRETKLGWNCTLSERRLGANGTGCHLEDVIRVPTLRHIEQAQAKEREMQNKLLVPVEARSTVSEIGRVKDGVTGKVYESGTLERMCESATELAMQGSWDPTDSSHLLAVKSALHLSAVPETILCRDSQQTKLIEFCKARITEGRPGSMYICGCPGTGKSLTVEKIKSLCGTWGEECPEMSNINCTSLTDPRRIYGRFLQALRPGCDVSDSNLSHDLILKQLKRILCSNADSNTKSSRRKMVVLIVDEMDYLITRDQSVLYDLFRLTSFANSRLVLLGIANAIDLTDRLLPKLRSMNFKVEVLTFPTYDETQILAVLRQRLLALPYSVFQPAALELCARRVAAAAGDMRKALFVCRNAIDVLEAEVRGSTALNASDDCQFPRSGKACALSSQRNTCDTKAPQSTKAQSVPQGNPELQLPMSKESGVAIAAATDQGLETRHQCTEQNLAVEVVPTEVRIDAMARALSRVFRSPIVETIRSLPRHQQLVLCAAVRQLRLSQNSLGRRNTKINRASNMANSTNLADLHGVYLDFCRSSGMTPLAAPEFSSACQVLSDQAMLVLGSNREDRLRKVGLKVDAEDVIFALQGVRYLKLSLLQ